MRRLILFLSIIILAGIGTPYSGFSISIPVDTSCLCLPYDTSNRIDCLNKIGQNLIEQARQDEALLYCEQALNLAKKYNNKEAEITTIEIIASVYTQKGNYRKALSRYIEILQFKALIPKERLLKKVYYNMAVCFAKIKNYPLALKYFHKSIDNNKFSSIVSSAIKNAPLTEEELSLESASHTLLISDDKFDLTDDDGIIINGDTSLKWTGATVNVKKIDSDDIRNTFDNKQKALAYGIMIHIKQPQTGNRKSFTGINNVGHMFISLIKFNTDISYTSRTFGFYPDKDYLLSATPILPSSSSMFKDDIDKDWDETVGIFISQRKFKKILRMIRNYGKRKYNLNKNNCTDFGLCIAAIAGIKIWNTGGTWPLGGGNNPANAGQSILERQIELETGNIPIFILPAL